MTGSRYPSTVGTITGKPNFKHQNIKEGEWVTVGTCAYDHPKIYLETFYEKHIQWHFKLPKIWESISSHYSGQHLKPFVIYIQVAWRKTLFIFVKSIGIRVSFVLFFVLYFCVLFYFILFYYYYYFFFRGRVLVFSLPYTAVIII